MSFFHQGFISFFFFFFDFFEVFLKSVLSVWLLCFDSLYFHREWYKLFQNNFYQLCISISFSKDNKRHKLYFNTILIITQKKYKFSFKQIPSNSKWLIIAVIVLQANWTTRNHEQLIKFALLTSIPHFQATSNLRYTIRYKYFW